MQKEPRRSTLFHGPFEVNFNEGLPEREKHWQKRIYPEELLDKKCGGCRRFQPRDHGDKGGYHCCGQDWNIDVFPDDKACVSYWDRAEQEEQDRLHQEDVEKRRQELWAIYAERDPVKLPIKYDGYGNIPTCPVCGELPYSTEQCHWCGQRFIQDEEVEDYSKPWTEEYKCPNCGTIGTVYRSKYNGHRHFHCQKCGNGFIE